MSRSQVVVRTSTKPPVVPPGGPTAPEWSAVQASAATADRLGYAVFDPSDPAYGAVRSTTDPGSATRAANTAAINAAAADAYAADGLLVMKGSYYVNPGVAMRCNVDGSAATLLFTTTTGTGLLYGSRTSGDRTSRRWAQLPKVINEAYGGIGWGGGANTDVGVELCNLYASQIAIPHVRRFTTNLAATAYGTGNVYNTYLLGHLDNGKVNLDASPKAIDGWVNNNVYVGGQFAHNSAEGSSVPGTRHVLMIAWPGSLWAPDNNLFVNCSLESPGVVEYVAEVYHGRDNRFLQCRWENTATARVWYRGSRCARNIIDHGYAANSVEITETDSAGTNDLFSWGGIRQRATGTTPGDRGTELTRTNVKAVGGATSWFANTNGTNSYAFAVLPNTAVWADNPATAYRMAVNTSFTEFKNGATDTNPRLQITNANGAMNWGPGNAAGDTNLSRRAANLLGTADDDSFQAGNGAWNGGHLRLGNYRIWVDATGALRIKSGAPTSDTDGTVVGAQT